MWRRWLRRRRKVTGGPCRMCGRYVSADAAITRGRRRFCSRNCEVNWAAGQLGADPYDPQ